MKPERTTWKWPASRIEVIRRAVTLDAEIQRGDYEEWGFRGGVVYTKAPGNNYAHCAACGRRMQKGVTALYAIFTEGPGGAWAAPKRYLHIECPTKGARS